MGFFQKSYEPQINIDYSRCTPVSVIATFSMDHRVKPLYFMVKDEYDNECKTKITGIKYTKECVGYTSFCCAYKVGSIQRECVLRFHVNDCVWVLEK